MKKARILLPIITLLILACNRHEWTAVDDCYKYQNHKIYLDPDRFSKDETYVVWGVTYEIDSITGYEALDSIACSWYEANKAKLKYNCDSFPKKFSDTYQYFRKNNDKCR